METTLAQILAKDLKQYVNLREVLASYRHITLTKDEILEAVIAAKMRKETILEKERLRLIEEDNRKKLAEKFDYMALSTFMMNTRAKNLFDGKFILDENNERIFEMMCYYFSRDTMFITIANAYGVLNPSLEKGILLCGNFGTGKSWLMKLFCQLLPSLHL